MSIIFNLLRITIALFSLVSLVASSASPASARTISLASVTDSAYTSTNSVVSRAWAELEASEGVTVEDSETAETTLVPEEAKVIKTLYREVTAYTSAVEECDSDPLISADGSVVFDGMVASNGLPFGTKLRMPDYFGDKVFEVRDRMNARYSTRIDIWMSNKKDMYQWGYKRNVKIEIIEMGTNAHHWNDPDMKEKRKQVALK